jgi:O-antigen/teichoic acid export membrane protein
MVGTTLVTSALGVAFWLLAAHNFSQSAVGVASAAVAAMTLLGFMGTLGLGTLLMGDLPRRAESHRSLLNAALLINLVTGTILGLAFALLMPLLSSNLAPRALLQRPSSRSASGSRHLRSSSIRR